MPNGFQVGMILFAFVIYTTLKGNLRKYLDVVGLV